jgi:hypothetical protein
VWREDACPGDGTASYLGWPIAAPGKETAMRLRKAEPAWWKVQARWTVDGEPRSYRSVYYESRRKAERAANDMANTLSHFPTLEMMIVPATAEEAAAAQRDEAAAIEALEPVPLHLMLDAARQVTACGKEGNWSTRDFWDVGDSLKCPECDAIAAKLSGGKSPGTS